MNNCIYDWLNIDQSDKISNLILHIIFTWILCNYFVALKQNLWFLLKFLNCIKKHNLNRNNSFLVNYNVSLN